MSFDDIITDFPAVPQADDNRHALRPEPHCREAAAFMFELPEHGIGGFLYPWINNDGTAGSAVVLFGTGVGESIQERFEAEAVPDDMDFHDWRVRGLTMRLGEPHKSVDLSFTGERVSIDCRLISRSSWIRKYCCGDLARSQKSARSLHYSRASAQCR